MLQKWRSTECFVAFLFIYQCNCDLVLLNVRDELSQSNDQSLEICAVKKQMTKNSADDYNVPIRLLDVTPYDGCTQIQNQTFANKTLFMRVNNISADCSLQLILQNLELNAARLVIIGTNGPIPSNLTNRNLTLSPILMPNMYADTLGAFMSKLNSPVVQLSSTNEKFDVAIIFIWIIAIGTVIFGSLWSSHEFKLSLKNQAATDDEQTTIRPATNETQQNNSNKNDDENGALLNLSYLGILFLLIFVIGILLLLYFFYDVMIFFVYVIFVLGAITSMYRVLCLIVDSFECGKMRIPANNIPLLKSQPQIVHLLLVALCVAICIVWFVFRHASWIWIIQNMMAISLAANALSFYRLSSYRIVTVMLVLFFLYDVFMVFISPLLTNGTSIMEAVAFGGRNSGSKNANNNVISFNNDTDRTNKLPVVIVIPRMSKIAQLCKYYLEYPYSLLGLGDMLIPGLSVNYAILFDIARKNRIKIYFIANIFAYGLGLSVAFIGLVFMNKAQPALFYLCPSHLIITLLLALIKRDFRDFWSGEAIRHYTLNNSFTRANTTEIVTQLDLAAAAAASTPQQQQRHLDEQPIDPVVAAQIVNSEDYKY